MLGFVLLDMSTHVAVARRVGISSFPMIEQRIQLVVSHDCNRLSLIKHGTHERQNRPLVTTRIDEVAEKGGDTSLRMPPNLPNPT